MLLSMFDKESEKDYLLDTTSFLNQEKIKELFSEEISEMEDIQNKPTSNNYSKHPDIIYGHSLENDKDSFIIYEIKDKNLILRYKNDSKINTKSMVVNATENYSLTNLNNIFNRNQARLIEKLANQSVTEFMNQNPNELDGIVEVFSQRIEKNLGVTNAIISLFSLLPNSTNKIKNLIILSYLKNIMEHQFKINILIDKELYLLYFNGEYKFINSSGFNSEYLKDKILLNSSDYLLNSNLKNLLNRGFHKNQSLFFNNVYPEGHICWGDYKGQLNKVMKKYSINNNKLMPSQDFSEINMRKTADVFFGSIFNDDLESVVKFNTNICTDFFNFNFSKYIDNTENLLLIFDYFSNNREEIKEELIKTFCSHSLRTYEVLKITSVFGFKYSSIK